VNDGRKILAAIEGFHPARSTRIGKEWLDLDDLVQVLPATNADPDLTARALLGVFERFPRHDGFEVFWTLLHYLEVLPGYERHLLESIQRTPNHMSVLMLQRMIHYGITEFDGIELTALLRWAEPLAPEVDFTVDPPV